MSYIFISYSHEDRDYVRGLVRELHHERFRVWLDERIDYGEHWPRVIEKKVDECSAFVVVMTQYSYESEWVQKELTRAESERKPILPLLREGKLWFALQTTQYVDVSDGAFPSSDFYERLSEYVQRQADVESARMPEPSPGRPATTSETSEEYSLPRVSGSTYLETFQGDRIIWAKDGKEMVRVPAGGFLFGTDNEQQYLPDFWMDRAPVTNGEYATFIVATNRTPPLHWDGKTPGTDISDHPVANVTWDQVVGYAEWAGKRLPTDEEWEKAARGADGRQYPWGSEMPTAELCNFDNNVRTTTPVGSYSPQGDSPHGCVDMSGNVWEWAGSQNLRGGAFFSVRRAVRATVQFSSYPVRRDDAIGFRLVVRLSGSQS